MDHATGTELFQEGFAVRQHHVTRVILVLWLLLGIQVVQVAKELVESMIGGQVLITVTEVVLAELASGITQRFEHFCYGRILLTEAFLGTRQADLAKSCAEHTLTGNKGRTSGCTGLLTVIIGEDHALFCDAIYVWRFISHQATGVIGDIGLADIVTPDNKNIRFIGCCVASRS